MTALTPLDTLWLTEAVRLREEQAGPLEDSEANRRARSDGGDLAARITSRALWLADRDGMRAARAARDPRESRKNVGRGLPNRCFSGFRGVGAGGCAQARGQ